jgi:hypothetical protein
MRHRAHPAAPGSHAPCSRRRLAQTLVAVQIERLCLHLRIRPVGRGHIVAVHDTYCVTFGNASADPPVDALTLAFAAARAFAAAAAATAASLSAECDEPSPHPAMTSAAAVHSVAIDAIATDPIVRP